MHRPIAVALVCLAPFLCLCTCEPRTGSGPAAPAAPANDEPAVDAPEEGSEEDQVVLQAVPGPVGGGLTLLAEAERQLGAAKVTEYQHRIEIDEAQGVFRYDCSGFLDYALARVAPDALAELRSKRPKAKDYANLFSSIPRGSRSGRWRRVVRATELVPGDVVAWLKPAELESKSTGHVVIVAAPPRAGDALGEVLVKVIDSSQSGHGADDARTAAKASGIGTGTVVLLVDATSVPVGYKWSAKTRSKLYSTEVSMGRLE